ncbi:hypothetical protein C5167_016472 [Papaver somniferum]|nr:hypothetical protein C5167_016472 [Papaver somniferum]
MEIDKEIEITNEEWLEEIDNTGEKDWNVLQPNTGNGFRWLWMNGDSVGGCRCKRQEWDHILHTAEAQNIPF